MSDYEFECPKCGGNNDASDIIDAKTDVLCEQGLEYSDDVFSDDDPIECGHCGASIRLELSYYVGASSSTVSNWRLND